MAGTTGALNSVVLNPRDVADFGRRHVILNGRTAKPMHVPSFTGPFSIKTVVSGRATWETASGRYVVTPGRQLVLNRGTRYSLTIDGDQPVETFCVFFQDGFVEDAMRSMTVPDARLLDDPDDRAESFALLETVHEDANTLGNRVAHLHRTLQADGLRSLDLSGAMQGAAAAVISRSTALLTMSRRLPATRSVTRRELVRRLGRARDYMRDGFEDQLDLAAIARAACLSPFHFHRSYRAFFGETPRQFVERLRMDCAADRLRWTPRSIIDVALSVGFEAPQFSRAFKRRFGCTPQEYRSRLR